VYFGHVDLMLLKPIYEKGIHVRRASEAEFAVLKGRHDLVTDDAAFTWMIEPDGDSFVLSAEPAWREAARVFEDPSLFDFSQPWPPDFPSSSAASDDTLRGCLVTSYSRQVCAAVSQPEALTIRP
jgi:hypothetical protein